MLFDTTCISCALNFVDAMHCREMFLNVAEDVKEGSRPEHSAAIAKKREVLYDWVEERTRVMLGQEPKAS